jgi:2-C-methyl-D-erythritol 4-phosphate cytidylyltransferase
VSGQVVVVIVLAAGRGERLGLGTPKAFLELGGEPLLVRAGRSASLASGVSSIVVVVPPGLETEAEGLLDRVGPHVVVPGGDTRRASVAAGLNRVPPDAGVVLCHDAARPFAGTDLFEEVIAGLQDAEGVVPVVPVPDTVKRVRDGVVMGTEPREELALAQTPQAFRAEALRDAHSRVDIGADPTDDASLLERAGYRVRAVPGDPVNFKITTLEDLARAEALLHRTGGRVG